MRAVCELPLAHDLEAASLEERLERGELVYFEECPFLFLDEEDHEFLLEQRLAGSFHKDICFDPESSKLTGFLNTALDQGPRLAHILARFSERADFWLAEHLPRYAADWQRDCVRFSPEEEVTRCLRQKARNDLLHIDAFHIRPTQGRRILRFFVNINPVDPRIWVTSDRFPKLLARFAAQLGLPSSPAVSWWREPRQSILGRFGPRQRSTPYDDLMLRFHDFLKLDDDFQEKCPKRLWSFAAGSAWLFFSDYRSHATLRGRYLIDQTFLVAPESLHLPKQAPLELLRQASRANQAPAPSPAAESAIR